jgi:prolyl-tRNA synthetase
MRRGIEIGHIFMLGRRFADAFGLDALGPDSKPIRITMGSYGVGVSRLVAGIAEQHHDERGLIWPAAVAPAHVHIVAAGKGDQVAAALTLGDELVGHGLDVIVDDRAGLSVGVRLTDAELVGAPWIVVVGRRLAEGFVELRRRADGETRDVALGEIAQTLVDEVGAVPGR